MLPFAALTDPILLALLALAIGLLLLGCLGGLMPRGVGGGLAALFCGTGAVLCALTLAGRLPAAVVQLPAGPPGLPLTLALDPVAALFLLVTMLCGTVLTAASALGAGGPERPGAVALVFAGLALAILGAGAAPLCLGLAIAAAGLWRLDPANRPLPVIGAAFLLLAALCLMAPPGLPPDFLPILDAAAAPLREGEAAVLTLAAAALLTLATRHGAGTAVLSGAVVPVLLYLPTRLLIDLPVLEDRSWWGTPLLLAGATAAVVNGWRAAGDPDLSGAVNALVRQQAGLAVMALGLCVIDQAADLPTAAAFALASATVLTVASATAGTLAALCAESISRGAGTGRLARLGGLRQTMPAASVLLALALLVLSVLPPSGTFAGVWLLAQAILGGPRSGGLLAQGPLALAAAALAASATLATVAGLRLIGIVLLGRPRTAKAAGAEDIGRWDRLVLAALAAVAVLAGLFPGGIVRLLAHPAIVALTGTGLSGRAGWMTLSASPNTPGYATLPVLALLLLAAGGVLLATRRYRAEARLSAVWTGGQPPDPTLPFGDPLAQSSGTGFRPALPHPPMGWPTMPRLSLPRPRLVVGRAGLWAMLICLGGLLLVTSLTGAGGP